MQAISPKLGEFLIKVTRSKDIDDAFRRVFSDYLELKIASFMEPIEGFRKKWGMEFDEFQKGSGTGPSKRILMLLKLNRTFGDGRRLKL